MTTNKTPKQLLVSAIKNGTVIDHITAGQALKIIRLLNLPSYDKVVTVGLNLPSREMKHKDLIKVEGRELSEAEVNQVAILSPSASINIIREYEIVKKLKVRLPEKIEHIIVCPNPKCITNNERMDTVFHVNGGDSVKLKCHYCEKIFKQDEIKDYHI